MRRTGILIFVSACVSHAWVLPLPFQLDDFFLFPRAGALIGVGEWPAYDDLESEALFSDARAGAPHKPDNWYYFRPTAWVTWWVVMKACGGRAIVLVFHLLMLALHGLTAWMLFRILARIVAPGGAALGAALFAVHPAGSQAVSWPSAMGDQYALVFAVAAALMIQRHRFRGGWRPLVLAALCCGLAQSSKDTPIVLAPAIMLAWLAGPSPVPWRSVWKPAAAVAAGFAAALFGRWRYVGYFTPTYLGPVEVKRPLLHGLWEMFQYLLWPWNRTEEFAALAPRAARWVGLAPTDHSAALLASLAAVLVLLPLAVAVARGGRNAIWRTALALLGLCCALVPPLVLPPTDSNLHSRGFYQGSAMLGVLAAVAIGSLPDARWRRWIIVALLPFALLTADVAVHYAATELDVGSAGTARLDSLDALTSHAPDTYFIAVDRAEYRAGIPMPGAMIASAMRPPFVTTPRLVSWRADRLSVDALPQFHSHPGPIQILRVEDNRFVPDGPPIPALAGTLPPAQVTPDGTAAIFSAAPAPRGVGGVRVRLRVTRGRNEPVLLSFVLDRFTREVKVGLETRSNGIVEAIVGAPGDAPWLTAGALRSIALLGATFDGPPMLFEQLPVVDVLAPETAEAVESVMRIPVRIRPRPEATSYRFTFGASIHGPNPGITLVFRAPLSMLTTVGPDLEFVASPTMPLEHVFGSDGSELTPATLAAELRDAGTLQFPVGVRVEAIGADGEATAARSAWRFFRVGPDPTKKK